MQVQLFFLNDVDKTSAVAEEDRWLGVVKDGGAVGMIVDVAGCEEGVVVEVVVVVSRPIARRKLPKGFMGRWRHLEACGKSFKLTAAGETTTKQRARNGGR